MAAPRRNGSSHFSFGCKLISDYPLPKKKNSLSAGFRWLLYFRILVLLHRTTGAVWSDFSTAVNDKVQTAVK